MKIWKLKTDANNYDYLTVANGEDLEKLLFDYVFEGKSITDRWEPIKVEVLEESKRSDTPTFSAGIPVLSEKALLILGDLIEGVTEILPLDYSNEKYYAINVIDVVDCINYEKAECERFKHSNRVMEFTKFAFKPEMIKDKYIFKVPEQPKSYVLVSDEFRNRVLNSGLEGFAFHELWDSEQKL